ncbi:unnamed protein product [Coregonus sp. 'balchen']|nr:unnamed protein product [Coregonus sp. 'balchen']
MSRSVKQERVEHPAPSCLSMKSNRSMEEALHVSGEVCLSDIRVLRTRSHSLGTLVAAGVASQILPSPALQETCVSHAEETMETETEEERERVSNKRKIIEVQEEEEDCDEEISELKNTISELRKEISELNSSKSDLEQEISKLKHDVGELSKENAVLKQEAFEKELMDIRIADLNKTIATLSSDLQQQREAEYVRRNLKNMKMDYG